MTTKEFSIWYIEKGEWKNGGTVYAKSFREAKEIAKRKFPKAKDYDVVLLKEFMK